MADLFISHASEDKEAVARPVAHQLRTRGWTVWYDEFDLKLGDSLRRSIDEGLTRARFGLVVLSPSFFTKEWPQRELDGLTAREIAQRDKLILPVWHEVDFDYVVRYSPPLADKLAVQSSAGIPAMVDHIERVLGAPKKRQPRTTPAAVKSARSTLAPSRLLSTSPLHPDARTETIDRKRSRPLGPAPHAWETTRHILIILAATILVTVIVIAAVRTVTT